MLTAVHRAERAPLDRAPPEADRAPSHAPQPPVPGAAMRAAQISVGSAFRLPSGPILPVSAAEQVGRAVQLRAASPMAAAKGDVALDPTEEQDEAAGVQMKPLGVPLLGVQKACAPACACDSCQEKRGLAVQRADAPEAGGEHAAEHDGDAEHGAAGEELRARPTPHEALAQLGPGSPIPAPVAARFSPAYGRDLSGVRVHPDNPLAAGMGAHAFTVGHHIAFAPGAPGPGSPEGDLLMAHELAHVVQQSGGTGEVQGAGLDYDGYEAEADQAASVAVRGGTVRRITPVRGGLVQRDVGGWIKGRARAAWGGVKRGAGAAWGGVKTGAKAVGGFAADVAEAGWDLLVEQFWKLVRKIAPSAEPYLRDPGKIWEDIKDAVVSGIDKLFGGIFDVFSKGGIFGAATAFFTKFLPAIGKVQKAIAKDDHEGIAGGVKEAIDAFSSMSDALFAPAKRLFDAVSGALKKAFSKVVGPIFTLLKRFAKGVWDTISGFIKGVVKIARKVGGALGRVWTWIKSKLGFGGGGDDSSEGFWARIKKWAGDLWDKAKKPLLKFVEPLKTFAKVLVVLSPIGPMVLAFKYGPRVVKWLKELWGVLKDPKTIPRIRQKVVSVLRGISAFLQGVAAKLSGLSETLNEKLAGISAPLAEVSQAIGASGVLKVLAAGIRLVTDAVTGAIEWVAKHVPPFIEKAGAFFSGLWAKLKPILDVVVRVIMVVANPLGIPMLVASLVWEVCPTWLKIILIVFILEILIRFIQALPDGALMAGAGPLGALIKHAILGFLKGLYGQGVDKLVAACNRIAKLMRGGGIDFLAGYAVGILSGIWDGIIGPIELVVLLIEGVAHLAEWLDKAKDKLPADIAALFSRVNKSATEVKSQAWPAIKSAFSGQGDSVGKALDLLKAAWGAVTGAAQSVGGAVASALMKFIMLPDYELGKKLGWVAGTVIFEVAIAVLTGGASAALAAAKGPLMRVLKLVVKMHDYMGKIFSEVLHMLGPLKRAIEKAVKAIGDSPALQPFFKSVGKLFADLESAVAKGLGRFGEKEAGKGAVSVATTVEKKAASELGDTAASIESKAGSAESKAASAESRTASAETKVAGAETKATRPHEEPGATKPKGEEPGAPKTREDRVKESGKKENLTQHEIDDELRHIGDNPHLVTGKPGERRVKIGEHEWVEGPPGKWCRYSPPPPKVCASPGQLPKEMQAIDAPSEKPRGEGETPTAETKPKGEEPVAETAPKGEQTAAPTQPVVPQPPKPPKPAIGEPGAAEWRFQQYEYDWHHLPEPKPPKLDWDKWYKARYAPAATGGRPGRSGGLDQQRTRKEMVEKEGFVDTETTQLGTREVVEGGVKKTKKNMVDGVKDLGDGKKIFSEVDEMLESGIPAAHMRPKLEAEIQALKPGESLVFVDKKNPARRITYHHGDPTGITTTRKLDPLPTDATPTPPTATPANPVTPATSAPAPDAAATPTPSGEKK